MRDGAPEIDQALARLDDAHPAPAQASARGTASRTSARSSRTRVEEAYELADAAYRGDDAKLLDELGDVLFQVHFLSLLLEERGAGDLRAGRRALPPRS